MKRMICLLFIICLLIVCCMAGCDSDDDYPAGFEECFRCKGAGMVNEGFIDFETCPTCRGSGMLDSH